MAGKWDDEELAAAVDAYLAMLRLEQAGESFNKRETYRELSQRFGRSEEAFEYRMQNISAVRNELGESWISGLKPAGNVGTNVKLKIRGLLERSELNSISKLPILEARYNKKIPAIRNWLIAVARTKTVVTYRQVIEAFNLDRLGLRQSMNALGLQSINLEQPIIAALIVSKKTGRCATSLKRKFGIADEYAEREKIFEYWSSQQDRPLEILPATNDPQVKAARFVSVEARPEQAAFRRRVYERHQGKCVITGCDIESALHAAHKSGREWRKGHNSADDGYLLRRNLHALYDDGLLRIDAQGTVELDKSLLEHYGQYQGKKIN